MRIFKTKVASLTMIFRVSSLRATPTLGIIVFHGALINRFSACDTEKLIFPFQTDDACCDVAFLVENFNVISSGDGETIFF